MKTQDVVFWLGLFTFFSCNKVVLTPTDEPENPIIQEGGDTPSPPVLIRPLDAQTCEEGEDVTDDSRKIDFKWGASENTSSYDLKVINLSTGKEQLKTNITATSETMVLEKNYPYSWQIAAQSSVSSETGLSLIWQFYVPGNGVINHAPFPATDQVPSSGAMVIPQNGKVALKWVGTDPDGDALTYTIYFDTVDGNQTPLAEHTDIEETSIDVAVQPDTLYFWRVKSSDGQNSSYTVPFLFRTQ